MLQKKSEGVKYIIPLFFTSLFRLSDRRRQLLRDLLNAEGVEIGRQHVATLMSRMHRSDLSQTEYEQTDAETQNLPVSAAQDAGHPAKPSLGHGYNIQCASPRPEKLGRHLFGMH
jgi:hypothetical protein